MEKMYRIGSIFNIQGDENYIFCQVATSTFALIGMESGNRYTEMKKYNPKSVEFPYSFIKELADGNKLIDVVHK